MCDVAKVSRISVVCLVTKMYAASSAAVSSTAFSDREAETESPDTQHAM